MISARRLFIAAAVFAAAIAVYRVRQETDPLQRLAASAPDEVRFFTARMSGDFPWAPIADATRGEQRRDVQRMVVKGVAGSVVKALAGRNDTDSRHARAVAYFFGDQPESAMRAFAGITEEQHTARSWNDLAALRYALASRTESLDELERALMAVDRALRLEPRMAEALFNRALILEQFHLREPAVEAWKEHLSAETNADWAAEGRQRLAALVEVPPSFASEVERLYTRLERGDREAARMLVRLDAGETRYFMQKDGLGRWAQAYLTGEHAAAARHLAAARTVGIELMAFNGEPIVIESVNAIDGARRSAIERLARGHAAFHDGRVAFREKRNPTSAETLLATAERELASGGSPMTRDARLFKAVAIFGQNRFGEAEKIFRQLDAQTPARYAALRGYLHWQLASCTMARAHWGEAIEDLQRAIGAFERLREPGNHAYVHDILSQVYDAVGDRDRARHSRLLALRGLGRTANNRLVHAIGGMVADASRRKEWRIALSLLGVQVGVARNVPDKELQVNVLLRRALLAAKLGDATEAGSDLRNAKAVGASVTDDALKTKLTFDCTTAEALIEAEPAEAVRLLSDALRFHSEKGWRMRLPDLHLRRGQMYLALNDRMRAGADFEAGIAELEQHRESLPTGEARWGVLNSADELFEQAVATALPDSAEAAFAYVERQRARSLSDSFSAGTTFEPSRLSATTALLSYAVLPHKLVIFVADREGLRAHEKEIGRSDLVRLLGRFQESIRTGDVEQRNQHTRTVHELLIAPVEDRIRSRRNLIVVPDPLLASVSLAMLANPRTGRRLLDDHVISSAPSATAFIHSSRRGPAARSNVLVVADPANDAMERLSGATAEAEAILAIYPNGQPLMGRAATVRSFSEHAPGADVIHFAGHGLVDGGNAALVLTPENGDAGRMDLRTVARLPLTRTSVVVVAACDTARGAARTGEGTLSVAYAFLQAGAPAVIATLWPISDSDAAKFFPRLHRHLAMGMPAAEALRLTQLELSRGSRDGAGVWAAVQCIGN